MSRKSTISRHFKLISDNFGSKIYSHWCMGSTGFCGEPMRKYEAHRKSEDALRRSIDVIYREKDTDAAVERVLSIAARFYSADRCYLYEYFEDENCYKNTYEWNRDGVSPIDKTMTYSEDTINFWLEDYGKEGEVWIASVEDEIKEGNYKVSGYSTGFGSEAQAKRKEV